MARDWNWMVFKVPSNPRHSMILRRNICIFYLNLHCLLFLDYFLFLYRWHIIAKIFLKSELVHYKSKHHQVEVLKPLKNLDCGVHWDLLFKLHEGQGCLFFFNVLIRNDDKGSFHKSQGEPMIKQFTVFPLLQNSNTFLNFLNSFENWINGVQKWTTNSYTVTSLKWFRRKISLNKNKISHFKSLL